MCLLPEWERASKQPAKRDGSFLLRSLVPLQFNPFLPLPRWTEHPYGQIGGVKRNLQFCFGFFFFPCEDRSSGLCFARCNWQSEGSLRLKAGSSL